MLVLDEVFGWAGQNVMWWRCNRVWTYREGGVGGWGLRRGTEDIQKSRN